MSDVPIGAGTYGATSPGTAGSGTDPSAGERAKQVAQQSKDSATQAASDVKDTAKEQAQRVAQEAKTQARSIASDVRGQLSDQARTQNDRLVGTIRQTADQLDEMRGDRADGPAAAVVSRVADGGRQFADYLDRHGPDGVLREVQDFARRRPGAFLATALAAGFVVGRLGKSVAKAEDTSSSAKGSTDEFVSRGSAWDQAPATGTPSDAPATSYATGTGYATGTSAGTGYTTGTTTTGTGYTTTGTEYASTGTGTPAVVEEYVTEYPPDGPR